MTGTGEGSLYRPSSTMSSPRSGFEIIQAAKLYIPHVDTEWTRLVNGVRRTLDRAISEGANRSNQ